MKPSTKEDLSDISEEEETTTEPTKNVVTGKDFAKLTIFKCL